MYKILFILFSLLFTSLSASQVRLGIDLLLQEKYTPLLKGKRVGIIANHTSVNGTMRSSIDVIKEDAKKRGYKVTALFAPEHGFTGVSHASENIEDEKDRDGIPIFSLHGKTRRPTDKMLSQLDLILYDIQDIGSRSYTYVSTLFYVMEEAAKKKIPVVVLDRPNPINGVVVDGPLLEEKWRSIVGYVNVPYCHGMTVGELALYFNTEHKAGCELHVIPMEGWRRTMTFADTGLSWIPTSPNVPEPTTPQFYPMTGILGELQIVNTGIGTSLPFKVVGSPWIKAEAFAQKMNAQKLPGVYFQPFYFKPYFGRYVKEECEGILLVVKDHLLFRPVTTLYVMIGIIKSMYPKQFKDALVASKDREAMFNKVNGTDKIYQILQNKEFVVWELKEFQKKEREEFLLKRERYLHPGYN